MLTPASTRYKDAKDLHNVLSTLHLCVLNTWQKPRHAQLATFTFGDIASQIDFLIVRPRQADAAAKGAQIIDGFRLASHATQPQSRRARFDQELLLRDLRQPVPPTALQQLRDEAGAQIQGVDNLSMHLLQVGRPTQSVELANSAKHMWDIFRQMRQYRRTAQGIVSAWKVWVQFQQAHRIHKQKSKQRVKQKRDDLLEQAQISARDGNLFGMWKIVKQLAPKAPRKRLQLNKDGHMLSHEEELQWIVQAYGERYGVGSPESAWKYRPRASDSGVTIDAADLADILSRLNPRKAVPRESVPPILLKACSSAIAQALASDVNSKWNADSPRVHQEWSDATAALLPKAHGRNRSPLDWRPIGLQDCLGKSVMTLLLDKHW